MINEIRKIIDDNWNEIKELIIKKVEAEQKPKTIWGLKIEDEEEYYCVESDGDILPYIFNDGLNKDHRDMGNAFLTEKEAEFEIERRKVEAIMRRYSRPFEYGEDNYHIGYYHNNNTLGIGVYRHMSVGIPYFESEEIAQKVVDEIGQDRLIKYWFGVEE